MSDGRGDGELEARIREMSSWDHEDRRLWEAALDRCGERRGVLGRITGRGIRPSGIAAVLIGAAGLTVVLIGVMDSSMGADSGTRQSEQGVHQPAMMPDFDAPSSRDFDRLSFDVSPQYALALERGRSDSADDPEPGLADDSDARRIAFDARMNLVSGDVRGVVESVRGLIDPDLGEFVGGVSISGEGGDARGELSLRVRGDRLESVLAGVRELGGVVSEQVTARDLTDQLVDTEARLRNERRTESELLELMSSHDRLDLTGLLRLRRELGEVRGRIEQMDASLLSMERRVTLATVHVRVRGQFVQPDQVVETGWDRFRDETAGYWNRGVRTLGRSLGALMAFVVGRSIWLIPGGLMLAYAWTRWKRTG